MTEWCEHCRDHVGCDHYDSEGMHLVGSEFGRYGYLLAAEELLREIVVNRERAVADPFPDYTYNWMTRAELLVEDMERREAVAERLAWLHAQTNEVRHRAWLRNNEVQT